MKKIFFFLSAIALLGLTAACVEQQPVNPNYDAATNSVKTAFAINIMTEAQTKATAAEVQATGTGFLGMEGMTVYPLAEVPDEASDLTAVTPIPLGSVSTADIYGTGDADRSSKIYNIQITTGTNNMVFYGHAPITAGNDQTSPSYGKLVQDGVNWSLQSIATDAFGTESASIATALNSVLTADWKAAVTYFTNTTNANPADYQVLIDLYNNLKPKANEVRQGSGEAVGMMVTDLYNNLNLFKDVAVSTAPDGSSIKSPKEIATAIVTAITTNFNVTTATGGGETTVALKQNATFPTDLKLPFGAAQLVWDDTNNQFKYATGPDSFYGNATISNVNKFVYPASLYYWVNSPVRVSSSESLTYPTTTTDWDAETWTSGSWVKNGTVSAETRGVALQYNIQYATALLESTVAYGENVKALTDNYAALHPAQPGETTTPSNQSITVGATSFQLKGIIIGGQPATVDWNWIMKSGVAVDNVVYDAPASPMAIPASGASEKLYTLLLDNYGTGENGNQAQKVPVALELVNNTGKDFWGKDNMIPAGGTFYLVGNLDLEKATGTLSFASADVSRAPYLTGTGTPRVFMQDYKTIATFTIGATSLQKAYSTIPDLRSTMLTFGISVDLAWKAGYTFTVEL